MLAPRFIHSLAEISAQEWNAVTGVDYPFTRHEFLSALEDSGAADAESGWEPRHLLIHRGDELVALLPLYLKQHSYGEYVFDWSWADAYRRYGQPYYPKLLAAIPYTPATGPRLCVRDGAELEQLTEVAANALREQAGLEGASSIHLLFPDRQETSRWQRQGLATRVGPQYHWFNHGFASFDDFLATFASRKRKSLRRERRSVAEQGLTLKVVEGADIDAQLWQYFYHCYQLTYAKRSGHGGYLNLEFFRRIGESMPEHLVMVVAERDGEFVAAALNFRDSHSLYGRYWGCLREYEFLHFETCYYQGIEYCIERGLQRFDPGAQGEHKIQRGFEPIMTYSNHWLADPAFADAIGRFLKEETAHIERYLSDARAMLPFKCGQ